MTLTSALISHLSSETNKAKINDNSFPIINLNFIIIFKDKLTINISVTVNILSLRSNEENTSLHLWFPQTLGTSNG